MKCYADEFKNKHIKIKNEEVLERIKEIKQPEMLLLLLEGKVNEKNWVDRQKFQYVKRTMDDRNCMKELPFNRETWRDVSNRL